MQSAAITVNNYAALLQGIPWKLLNPMGIAEAKDWLCTQVSTDCDSEGEEEHTWRGAPQWLDFFKCYMTDWAESSGWGDDGDAWAVMAANGGMA
jgi:hypothetical protein